MKKNTNTTKMILQLQILIFGGSLLGVHCFNDFLVMGDWGGLPIWPYEDPAETGIASAMDAITERTGAYVYFTFI